MIIKFSHPNVPVSPRKIRPLVAAIKKMDPPKALTSLKFTNSKSARILARFVKNALVAANLKLPSASFSFDSFLVNEGQKIKRMDKSHGSRFARGIIQKRHSRLSLTLSATSDKIPDQKINK